MKNFKPCTVQKITPIRKRIVARPGVPNTGTNPHVVIEKMDKVKEEGKFLIATVVLLDQKHALKGYDGAEETQSIKC